MDGSGRWATARGGPRSAGHRAGARAARRAIGAAPGLGVDRLTLYAFSADNWGRPPEETEHLMEVFRQFFQSETEGWRRSGVRLEVIGRRDRLPPALRGAIEAAERATAGGGGIELRLAIDYSARDAILEAARGRSRLVPDVDLLVRTGGEQRLSDFLLWECAYAELVFTRRMWPDFGAEDFRRAVEEFHRRERRFGVLPAATAVMHARISADPPAPPAAAP